MEAKINEIVIEAVDQAKMESSMAGTVPTYNLFIAEVGVILMGMEFENSTARSLFSLSCERALSKVDPEFKQLVQPAMGMDEDGNYTSDKSKWA
jgi:hypothetical protein